MPNILVWCPDCQDFHEVEMHDITPGRRFGPRPPGPDPLEFVAEKLASDFQWIEEVRVEANGLELQLKIKHSYPKGVVIAPLVRKWLAEHLAPQVTAKTTYRRVEPVKKGR